METHENAPAQATQRYQLGECVGRGGLGAVYRAWDARLGRWVAIKRLDRPAAADAAETEASISREATALAALQHPNVVTIYDTGLDEEGPYVIMEFIEGQTLEQCVAGAPFDGPSFVDLAAQSLLGLAAAHRAGLLHRDLKPGNVMLSGLPDGGFQVKLLDFGLARFSVQPSAQTVDQAGSLLGSIYFMAPEQFGHVPLDARTDLYALGCVFYYALTDRHPFTGETVAATIASHLEHHVRDLATLRPDLPAAVARWVMRLLSVAPDDRPATALDALASLHSADGTDAAALEIVQKPVLKPVWKQIPRRYGVVVAIATLLGAGLLWPAFRPVPRATSAALPSVSVFANVPVAHAKNRAPGSFTFVRSGDQSTVINVEYLLHGSAKNGIDYVEIPRAKTIGAGKSAETISIVPLSENPPAGEAERHVKINLVASPAYTIGTSDGAKVKIVYNH